jgi:hypothetical protein
VYQPIEDGVGESRIADVGMPIVDSSFASRMDLMLFRVGEPMASARAPAASRREAP